MECYFFQAPEYKYGQFCTPLSQSHCRYFFVLAIIIIRINGIVEQGKAEEINPLQVQRLRDECKLKQFPSIDGSTKFQVIVLAFWLNLTLFCS